jgi:hypothetical protein
MGDNQTRSQEGKTTYHRRQRRYMLSITKAPTSQESVSLYTQVAF